MHDWPELCFDVLIITSSYNYYIYNRRNSQELLLYICPGLKMPVINNYSYLLILLTKASHVSRCILLRLHHI